MATKAKTGQKAPVSGQYKPVGSKTEVTLVKGKTVPPHPRVRLHSYSLIRLNMESEDLYCSFNTMI